MYVYVYSLTLENGELYVGQTNNPKRRLRDHKRGIASIHTVGRGILRMDIIWNGEVSNKYQAMLIENTQANKLRLEKGDKMVHGGDLSPKYKKQVVKKAFVKAVK